MVMRNLLKANTHENSHLKRFQERWRESIATALNKGLTNLIRIKITTQLCGNKKKRRKTTPLNTQTGASLERLLHHQPHRHPSL